MSDTNAMKQLRGPKHDNLPVCDPRAAPPAEQGLKGGTNGHVPRRGRATGQGSFEVEAEAPIFVVLSFDESGGSLSLVF
jgi:hypothetical protein